MDRGEVTAEGATTRRAAALVYCWLKLRPADEATLECRDSCEYAYGRTCVLS